jgi:hypothetical protein
MSNVCAKCFQDKIAQRFIRTNGSLGNCDFCDSRNRKVIHAYQLKTLFEEVVSLYERHEPAPGPSSEFSGGESLAECLSEWEIFPEDGDETSQNAILDEIMGFDPHDGDICASDEWQSTFENWAAIPLDRRWPWFAEHLMRYRRFVIDDDPTGEIVRPELWVPGLLTDANAVWNVNERTHLFRGRMGSIIGKSPHAYRLPREQAEMGAPPPHLARAGRVNPEGMSFLYCALEAKTAIVETGRFPGAVVSLREVRVRKPLRLADLRGKRSIIEPLATPALAQVVRHATLLRSLGSALGAPIHPEESAVQYIPTQYLAEVIMSAGYDGICFPSALIPEGTNIVIFNPSDARITRRGSVFELGGAKYEIKPKLDHAWTHR